MFIMYKLDQNPFIDARDMLGKPEKYTENRSRIRTQGLYPKINLKCACLKNRCISGYELFRNFEFAFNYQSLVKSL